MTTFLLAAAALVMEPGRTLLETDFRSGGLGGWELENFQDALTVSVTNAGDGAALSLENRRPGKRDTLFMLRSGFFAVEPETELAAVVEARGDISMLAPRVHNGIATAILWYGPDRQPILRQDVLGKMVPAAFEFGFGSVGTKWIRSVRFCTVPDGAAFAKVQLGGDAPDIHGGKRFELKRFTLRARAPEGPWDFGDLEPPRFELLTETPNPDPHAVIRFRISDASKLDRAAFACRIDGADARNRLRHEGGGVLRYVTDRPWAEDSLHLIELDVSDVCGNRGTETLAFFCGRRIEKGVVTLRDDGMTLIDGKPFFPIAPFSFRKCPPNGNDLERGLRELKAGGCNAVHSYLTYRFGDGQRQPGHRDYLELLEACERTGMKLIVEVAGRDYANPARPQQLREALLHGRDRTCLLAWGIGDDTSATRTGPEVRNDHNVIKAIDNARLTTQADGATFRGRYLQFVGSTDAFMVEIYPYKAVTPEPDALANLVRYMGYAYGDKRTAGNPVKGIWPIVQAFSGWEMWHRFPTTAEIRAQTYLGIIHGGRAATYYTYYSFSKGANGAAHSPQQLESLFTVTRELASIQDDLASRDAKRQPTIGYLKGPRKDLCGGESVECLLKEGADGRGPLLIAASTVTDKSVTVQFGGVRGRVETLFEDGHVFDVPDVLVDVFRPGEVHVYRLK